MAALVVVTDGVIGLKTDPLGDGAVLAHLLAQSELDAELLVGRLCHSKKQGHKGRIIVRNNSLTILMFVGSVSVHFIPFRLSLG